VGIGQEPLNQRLSRYLKMKNTNQKGKAKKAGNLIKRDTPDPSEDKTFVKRFRKWLIVTFIGGVVVAVAGYFVIGLASHYIPFPWEKPTPPKVISSPSPNAIVNYGATVDIVITAIPDFKPPYVREISQIIPNDNPRECDVVLDLVASNGFNFMPLNTSLPENIIIQSGYEYQNKMRVYIRGFPPKITYELKLSVYTLKPDIYGGTEEVTCNVIETNY
jgi:hypothetical protein